MNGARRQREEEEEESSEGPPPLAAQTQRQIDDDGENEDGEDENAQDPAAADRARQKTRKKQRAIQEIVDHDLASGALTSQNLGNVYEKNEELFKDVKEATEGVHDARIMRTFGESVFVLSKNVQTGMRVQNPEDYIKKVQELLGGPDSSPKWSNYSVGDCYASIPMATFLYGPLGVEKKKVNRKATQRRALPEGEAVRPTQVSEEMLEAEKNEETTKRIQVVWSALSSQDEPVDLWQFVLDPQSFTRTVENIFHLSFLVKEGRARIAAQGTRVTVKAGLATKEGTIVKNHQAIVSIDFATWELLCKRYRSQQRPLIQPLERLQHAPNTQSQAQAQATLRANATSASRKRPRPPQEEEEEKVENEIEMEVEVDHEDEDEEGDNGGGRRIKAEPKRKRQRGNDSDD